MNEKIENLIKQMRDKHLISLGLIDENRTEREYVDYYSERAKAEHAKRDRKTGKYYLEKLQALDITDEEYEEICKYFPPAFTQIETLKTTTAAENTLNIVAVIVLICGIIGSLICFYVFAVELGEGWLGFIMSIGILLISLITWAILKIVCEIAMNLRQINNKTK